ncbi:MAG: redoxin domain-containing protein [Bacteroidales bacterium]|jgi:hypothetical protein|nr:redoxin domain-containing protein [Bacteroidales bacterium]
MIFKGKKILIVFILLTVLIIAILLNTSQIFAQLKTDLPVPDFSLETPDGKIHQLSHFLNKQTHLFLCFVNSDDQNSITKIEGLISFLNDYQPVESYQLIIIIKMEKESENINEQLLSWQENTNIPFIVLLDYKGKATDLYQIEKSPTILLLRTDLHLRRSYDNFNRRQEEGFYQYLTFILTSPKSTANGGSTGCDDDDGDVCPPPPGY